MQGSMTQRYVHRIVRGDIHRIIPSRFPPVSVFDGLAAPDELEFLFEIEGLTNDRLRQELGHIDLVPLEDRLAGPGTTPIMAAFCHPNPDGSRFSNGSYGVYYAGLSEETAIVESAFHRERFLRQSPGVPGTRLEMRRYVTTLRRPMTLLPADRHKELLDPDSYAVSQSFGREVRDTGAWGLYYRSVRHAGGRCVAAFRPPALAPVRQVSHYRYHWDGQRITQIERVDRAYTLHA